MKTYASETSVGAGLFNRFNRFNTAVSVVCLAFVLLFPRPGLAQDPPLKFFKNYFVTGDYVVRGASLWRKGVNGRATALIPPLGGGCARTWRICSLSAGSAIAHSSRSTTRRLSCRIKPMLNPCLNLSHWLRIIIRLR